MKNLLKKDRYFSILAIVGIVFFFIYSYLPISQLIWQNKNNVSDFSLKFNTPDEVINYYFTHQYAQTGELYYFEPLDNFMNRVVFPRWALAVNGKITPGNFLGIDLIYGTLAKITSNAIIPFLTPLFAVVGVLFFYLLLKYFFQGKKIAFISALLLFIFPGFWYYASRTMFHNVLFVSLLIISLYLLLKLLHTNQHKLQHKSTQKVLCILSILTGLFFGLSLIVRTSEIGWIFLIVLTIVWWLTHHLFRLTHHLNGGLTETETKTQYLWPYLLISLIIFVLCFIPVFYHNKILYNNYFSTGYPLTTVSSDLESGQVGSISFLKALILPFGFDLETIITHTFYNYILKLFWPWLILWLIGLILFLKQKKTKEQKLYLIILSLVSCLLSLYYGSWHFKDSIHPNLISLGSSYVRYFLPMFVLNIPLIAFLYVKVSEYPVSRFKKILFHYFIISLFFCLIIYSGYQVLFQGPESLTSINRQLITHQIQSQDLLKYIQEDDIVLMDIGADKILFPQRKHLISPQDRGVEWPEIKKVLPYKKVYYFHHNEKMAKDYLNEIKFNPQGLELDDEVLIKGGGKLFVVKRMSSEDYFLENYKKIIFLNKNGAKGN